MAQVPTDQFEACRPEFGLVKDCVRDVKRIKALRLPCGDGKEWGSLWHQTNACISQVGGISSNLDERHRGPKSNHASHQRRVEFPERRRALPPPSASFVFFPLFQTPFSLHRAVDRPCSAARGGILRSPLALCPCWRACVQAGAEGIQTFSWRARARAAGTAYPRCLRACGMCWELSAPLNFAL